MNLNDTYQNLLQCVTTFERICTGSPFYTQTQECRERLEALQPIIIQIANDLTLELWKQEIQRKTESPIVKDVAGIKRAGKRIG